VYGILNECGLDAFYDLSEKRLAAVSPSGRSFAEFDHESFHDLYVQKRPDGLSSTELYIEGIHCSSCVWLVERLPQTLSGVARVELNAGRALVSIAWNPAKVTLSVIATQLDRLGYRPHPYRGVRADTMRRREDRASLMGIGVAGALAVNVMMLALALYGGWFTGMDPAHERFLRWISMTLTFPALVGPGRVFFRGAWAALRTRTLHMDLPIAIAMAAGFARGAINTITDNGPIYFDGVAALIFLLLVGRFLQQRAQRSAADSAELLHSLAPATAHVVQQGGSDDETQDVPVDALLPGMIVEVRDGETLPADGVVISGTSRLDRSLLTGESRLESVARGDAVYAGTVNQGALLCVRVDEAGETTRLGRILAEVEAGAQRRAPVVQLADRMAGVFVGVVLVLAVITAAYWWRTDSTAAIDHAIALLIVTCPCALALATPLAVSVAIGRAARSGVLIRGGDALERLAKPGRMFLDKTGTVTEGRTQLVAWNGPDWVKPLVLAVERHASHPLAEGFRNAWSSVGVPEAQTAQVVTGGGVEGEIDGRLVVIGSPSFVAERVGMGEGATGERDDLTPVHVAVDGQIVARAGFGDALRPHAARTVAALERAGYEVHLLSGDDPRVVQHVAAELGIAAERANGGVSPEAKLAAVEAAEAHGSVFMVGDGNNDAAAIARATVGIGVGGGAEACMSAADVYLSRPGLNALQALVKGAQRTFGIIRRNMVFSLVYNVVGASLAMAGLLHPLIAALMMPASSLTVVLSSWWGRTFEEEPKA
jgi:Cu2+-exporting ATPase